MSTYPWRICVELSTASRLRPVNVNLRVPSKYWANCCQCIDIVAVLGRVSRLIHKLKRTRVSGGRWKRGFGLRQIVGNVETDCATRRNKHVSYVCWYRAASQVELVLMFNFSHLDYNCSQHPLPIPHLLLSLPQIERNPSPSMLGSTGA